MGILAKVQCILIRILFSFMNWGRGVHGCPKLLVLCACSRCWMSVASVVRKKDLLEVVVTSVILVHIATAAQTSDITHFARCDFWPALSHSCYQLCIARPCMPLPAPPLPWNNYIGWLGIKHLVTYSPTPRYPALPCKNQQQKHSSVSFWNCDRKLWMRCKGG